MTGFQLMLMLAVVATVAIIGSGSLPALNFAASGWIVSDGLAPSDLIIILGGGLDLRPQAAADLYKRGFASYIAVGYSEYDHGVDGFLTRQKVVQAGVEDSAILKYHLSSHNTYGEAQGILQLVQNTGARSIIIPVEIFQTRRVRWIFNRVLRLSHTHIMVHAITPPNYNPENWWRTAEGFRNFRSEIGKYIYYRLRY